MAQRAKIGRKERRLVADKIREFADVIWEDHGRILQLEWSMHPGTPDGRDLVDEVDTWRFAITLMRDES